MRSLGLDVIAEENVSVRPSLLPQMNDLHLLSMMDVPSGLSKAIDSFRNEHLEGLGAEFKRGVSTVDNFICVVGRKTDIED